MGDRINRVTTGRGDGGTTQLGTGERVAKTDDRIAALGDVDELNAHLGLLRAALPKDPTGPGPRLDDLLLDLQHRLFDLGGALSLPGTVRFDDAAIGALETLQSTLNAPLPPLKNFVLPGGSEVVARAHVARTVCRRAERTVHRLSEDDPALGVFLNRLSDLLFTLARVLGQADGSEVLWSPRPRGDSA
ncbi:MAG: hypothetical protein RLZZ174_1810 [Pseudomonadota bacterium]|jgi:cob(I)alamin adenosyltransferase